MNKLIIFYDPSFPYAGDRPDTASLDKLQGAGRIAKTAEQLSAWLAEADGKGCFVNLHAPYFPKEAWLAIAAYLRSGGGLLSVGEAPFRIPVRQVGGLWAAEQEQTSYHQELLIHEAMRVDGSAIQQYAGSEEWPLAAQAARTWKQGDTASLILHVTRQSDLPHEGGTAGPMDAHIYPLIKGLSAEGREIAAPVVLLEHTKGLYAGGRWIMANQRTSAAFWEAQGAASLAAWAKFCAAGVTELWLKPSYASYDEGDRPALKVQLQRLHPQERDMALNWELLLTVRRSWTYAGEPPAAGTTEGLTRDKGSSIEALDSQQPAVADGSAAIQSELSAAADAAGQPLWQHRWRVQAGRELHVEQLRVPLPLTPGFYTAVLEAITESGERRVLRQGFWCRDEKLLSAGKYLTCDRDYFMRDGEPLPIVGMTYMTSDVARKFIFLPNAAVWDRDMETMKRAGINLIRTGIWTAYRNVMYADGHPSEEVLRALDAFFLTAKKHGLEVTFTFFAFTPEAWEGVNPYLDPRSIEAQKRFISSIVARHRESKHVHWDLINEPSMFDPKRIFEGPRTAGDSYEREAFQSWLRKRHYDSIDLLQQRWGMSSTQLPSFESIDCPEHEEINFDIQDMRSGKKGTRWLDYTLFTMEQMNGWAARMREALQAAQPKQLVTIGQDEALAWNRPSPFFYAEAVDYTTNHSWWLNDQLVWDGLFAKTPDKPNLIQETGIMYVETPDGRAKRSEEELRDLLERKYAYSFSTGGAGAVQWLWNTNFYMNNVNESNIGALRADGTEKPEADVSYDFGQFMASIRSLFVSRQLEDVAVVFPYSNDFGNRKLAAEATARLTRVLCYELKQHFRAVSEYELESLMTHPAKLIAVPSPHNFSRQAFDRLLDIVRATGSKLLFTGPMHLDEYWHPVERQALWNRVEATEEDTKLWGKEPHGVSLSNVQREEAFRIGEQQYKLSYGQRKIAKLFKERTTADGSGPEGLTRLALGSGQLYWCGQPVECNDRTEPIAELYRYMLQESGAQRELVWHDGADNSGLYGKKLTFAQGQLYIFVSEFGYAAPVRVTDPLHGQTYSFEVPAGRIVMFAADRAGKLLSVYRQMPITVS